MKVTSIKKRKRKNMVKGYEILPSINKKKIKVRLEIIQSAWRLYDIKSTNCDYLKHKNKSLDTKI